MVAQLSPIYLNRAARSIDGGPTANCPAIDQRGLVRPQGQRCDIGAVEVVAHISSPTVTLPPIIHAAIENGVKATLALNPNHGDSGQRITISGGAPAGYTQVRITSARNGQTVGAAACAAGWRWQLQR